MNDNPDAEAVTLPIYSAVAIITRGDRVLVASRKSDFRRLGFPGGKLNPGEPPELACVREVLEETGIRIERMYEIHRGPASDSERQCVAYWVKSWHGEPMAMEDDVMVGWVRWLWLFGAGHEYSDFHRKAFQGYKRVCGCLKEDGAPVVQDVMCSECGHSMDEHRKPERSVYQCWAGWDSVGCKACGCTYGSGK